MAFDKRDGWTTLDVEVSGRNFVFPPWWHPKFKRLRHRLADGRPCKTYYCLQDVFLERQAFLKVIRYSIQLMSPFRVMPADLHSVYQLRFNNFPRLSGKKYFTTRFSADESMLGQGLCICASNKCFKTHFFWTSSTDGNTQFPTASWQTQVIQVGKQGT